MLEPVLWLYPVPMSREIVRPGRSNLCLRIRWFDKLYPAVCAELSFPAMFVISDAGSVLVAPTRLVELLVWKYRRGRSRNEFEESAVYTIRISTLLL